MANQKDKKIVDSNTRLDVKQLLPDDERSLSIMKRRARTLSAVDSRKNEELAEMESYIKFKTGNGEYYGIPYSDIMDIKESQNITGMPNVPEYVSGVQYWHGKIIPVIHLAKYFGLSAVAANKGGYIVTVSLDDLIIGFLFEYVIGVDHYHHDKLDVTLSSSRIRNEYVIGISKGAVTILDIKNVVKDLAAELGNEKGIGYEKI